jgi:hypothetical protein
MAVSHDSQPNGTPCSLTLEDEFVLTQIRTKATGCKNSKERDQFFWNTILRMVARERAYKTVMSQCDIYVSVNIDIFEEDED